MHHFFKKLSWLCLLLPALVLLMLANTAFADGIPKAGDRCLYCNKGTFDWKASTPQQHGMGCSNTSCQYSRFSASGTLLWGDHMVNGSKCVPGVCDICGNYCNLSHSGGTPTCKS